MQSNDGGIGGVWDRGFDCSKHDGGVRVHVSQGVAGGCNADTGIGGGGREGGEGYEVPEAVVLYTKCYVHKVLYTQSVVHNASAGL